MYIFIKECKKVIKFKKKMNKQVEELLETLDLSNLNSLVGTVTQYLAKEECKKKADAVNIILRHSTDVKSLLKRKLITREVLFNYLNIKKVPMCSPHTKESLIENVLNYWEESSNTNQDEAASNSLNVKESRIIDINKTSLQERISHTPNAKESTSQLSDEDNVVGTNELAMKFAEWFYNMFNEAVPIGAEHFWQNCTFKLNLKNGNTVVNSNTVENNSEDVVSLLYRTKTEHEIYLNPNLRAEGIQGRMDNHGLVLVLACGTIHKDNLCVGFFEQIFALIKDPSMSNNWRIKHSELNLRNQPGLSAFKPPCLIDSELTSNLLQLPEC